ncbi:unnamed protein product, partial [Closterium sp. NIES-54]
AIWVPMLVRPVTVRAVIVTSGLVTLCLYPLFLLRHLQKRLKSRLKRCSHSCQRYCLHTLYPFCPPLSLTPPQIYSSGNPANYPNLVTDVRVNLVLQTCSGSFPIFPSLYPVSHFPPLPPLTILSPLPCRSTAAATLPTTPIWSQTCESTWCCRPAPAPSPSLKEGKSACC